MGTVPTACQRQATRDNDSDTHIHATIDRRVSVSPTSEFVKRGACYVCLRTRR